MGEQRSTNKPVRRKQDGLFSKKIVRHVLFVVNSFTVAVLVVSWLTGGIGLDTLIKEWFSFFRVEVLALAGITVTKSATAAIVSLAEVRKDKKDDLGGNGFG